MFAKKNLRSSQARIDFHPRTNGGYAFISKMNEDKAGTGMKMAANSSLHHARVEQKGYPCLLALGWLGLIFITFVAGACGPSVLETGAYGSLFNASNNMGVRFGDTDGFMEGDDYVNEDGTITHVHKNAVKASMLFFDYTPRGLRSGDNGR